MPREILMPSLSPTMEEGKLAKWSKKEGDKVSSGDILAEIETDKAMMDYEALDDGIMGKILVAEGTEGVKVNAPIAILLLDGESKEDLKAYKMKSIESDIPKEQSVDISNKTLVAENNIKPPSIEESSSDMNEIKSSNFVTMTVREALNTALKEEMKQDKDVFIMGEEVAEYEGAYKITQGLLKEFGPDRVVDTPITEMGFTGVGVGASYTGLKPVVEFMTFNFAMQAIDHIINSAAKTFYMSNGDINCPIVFRGPNGAAASVAAQHSQCYAAWYAGVPGLIVMAPYSAEDAKGLLKSAIRSPNPVVFLENEMMYGVSGEVPVEDDFVIPIGKAKLELVGSDVTIVSYSIGVDYAKKAADLLIKEGISVEIINLRTLRPIDMDCIINSVKKTNRLVTVEEAWGEVSIGSYIAAEISERAFDYLDAPVIRVSGKSVPMPYASNLEKMALPSVNDIVEAVKAVSYR